MLHSLMYWKGLILLQPDCLFLIRVRNGAPVMKSGTVT